MTWDLWGVSPLFAIGVWITGWVVALWYAHAYSNEGGIAAMAARVAVAALIFLPVAFAVLLVGGNTTSQSSSPSRTRGRPSLAGDCDALVPGSFCRLEWPGTPKRHVLLVGSGVEAQSWTDRVVAHPERGIVVVGQLSDGVSNSSVDESMLLGKLSDLPSILRQHVVDEVAICLPSHRWARGAWAVAVAREAGKAVSDPRAAARWQPCGYFNRPIPSRPSHDVGPRP